MNQYRYHSTKAPTILDIRNSCEEVAQDRRQKGWRIPIDGDIEAGARKVYKSGRDMPPDRVVFLTKSKDGLEVDLTLVYAHHGRPGVVAPPGHFVLYSPEINAHTFFAARPLS